MTKVGLFTVSSTPSAFAAACVKVVLPAPSSPESLTIVACASVDNEEINCAAYCRIASALATGVSITSFYAPCGRYKTLTPRGALRPNRGHLHSLERRQLPLLASHPTG